MNAGLDRSNIYYEVCLKQNNLYNELLRRLGDTDGAKIIYRFDERSADSLARKLQHDGVLALPYHSRLNRTQQNANLTLFLNNHAHIIVTTGSFSSEIDKADIRLVIHYELPRSIHRYIQETGKAGLDGQPARCTLFVSYQDVTRIKNLIRQDLPPRVRQGRYADLQQMVDYTASSECRLSLLLKKPEARCSKCDNCCTLFPELDWTINAQKFLSCVARFEQRGQSFGISHTIEVLRGSRNEKIFRYNHDNLSTYRIGEEKSAKDWKILAQLLLFEGLIEEIPEEGYTTLKLNDKSWEVMRNQRPVCVRSATWKALESQIGQVERGYLYTLKLWRQGLSVEEIAQNQGYQEETILGHLARLILEGEPINIDQFISRFEQIKILQALITLGIEPLQPVYEHLGERYKYGHIKLVLAHWQKFGKIEFELNIELHELITALTSQNRLKYYLDKQTDKIRAECDFIDMGVEPEDLCKDDRYLLVQNTDDYQYYLDKQTGEIRAKCDFIDIGVEPEDFCKDDRYLLVPTWKPDEEYKTLIKGCTEERYDSPYDSELRYRIQERCMIQFAIAWLSSENIKPILNYY